MNLKLDQLFDYYDISPEISEELAVWPGDTPFRRSLLCDFAGGGNLTLSTIHSTVHLGAHADAPIHYHPEGEGIERRGLHFYLGPCQVITVSKPQMQQIFPEDLGPEDLGSLKIKAKRVLFRTDSYPDPNRWQGDFVSLSPSLIEFLASHGVILVGLDTPSIDLSESKLLETHQAVFKNNMAVLEGVILKDVPDGIYTLVALPLKIKGADASPVRAILIKGKSI